MTPVRSATVLVTLAAFAVLALLSSCDSGHRAPGPAPADTPAAPSEGPAASAHAWPDGLTAKVVAIERMDPKLGNQTRQVNNLTLLKLTVTLTNGGGTAVPLPHGRFLWQMLTGPNRQAVSDDEGDQFTGGQLTSPVPEQVAAGQTVTLFDSWDVPTDQLATVAVRVDLGGTRDPYVFTDVQALLKS